MKKRNLYISMGAMCLAMAFASCSKSGNPSAENPGDFSTVTGEEYNTPTGLKVEPFAGQPEGPNLVYIEGGRTVLGSFEEDLLNTHDNIERAVTVASFWMDKTEIANIHWLEYCSSLKDSGLAYFAALPDTEVWLSELAFNDPYKDHYYRYPGFRFYPVVGIKWDQAVKYCAWRTRVVNTRLGRDAGLTPDPNTGRIPLESGVVVPDYRLPTEAEWEYAAYALFGTSMVGLDENQPQRRLYPWDGHAVRNPYGAQMGHMMANFKRGRGDYAGIAGKLNDGAMITCSIYENPPNDYGLYNMAGNVNEWVLDLYRPLSFQDADDLNPFRRNGYLDPVRKGDVVSPITQVNTSQGYDKGEGFTLITDSVRVIKGGSWKDVAYWMSPGTRRFLRQDSCTSTTGFRCAMINAGRNY